MPAGKRFYISDNPVTLNNRKTDDIVGNLGLQCYGIEIYLPLSSELTLHMLCSATLDVLSRGLALIENAGPQSAYGPIDTKPAREIVDAFATGNALTILPENVDFMNGLQVNYCSRFLISETDDFELVRRMLREFPRLREPPRMSVR